MRLNTVLFALVLGVCLGLSSVVYAATIYEKDFTTAVGLEEWVRYSGMAPELRDGTLVLTGSTDPVIVSDAYLDLISLVGDFVLTMNARLEANTGWGFVVTVRMNMWERYGATGYQLAVKPYEIVLGKQGPNGFQTIFSQGNPVDFSEFHDYTIRAEGNTIKVWIDDVLYFDYTDTGAEYPEVYSQGHFALKSNRSTLLIREMKIESL